MSQSGAHAALPEAEPGAIERWRAYGTQVLAVVGSELQKLRHDPLEVFTRAVQPMLWLLLFGGVMAQVRGLNPGGMPYLDFLAPGILSQSVLFVAIFYGISVIWERDLGVMQRYLVSPAPRSALVLGKALSASVRGLIQAIFVYLLAVALGIGISLELGHVTGAILVIILGSCLFSTFSLIIACIVRTRERFMGIGQVMTMPIFFASSAIYPLSLMPEWLRVLSHANPLTYQVDALRELMLVEGTSTFGIETDFAVLLGVFIVLLVIAARIYPRLGY